MRVVRGGGHPTPAGDAGPGVPMSDVATLTSTPPTCRRASLSTWRSKLAVAGGAGAARTSSKSSLEQRTACPAAGTARPDCYSGCSGSAGGASDACEIGVTFEGCSGVSGELASDGCGAASEPISKFPEPKNLFRVSCVPKRSLNGIGVVLD